MNPRENHRNEHAEPSIAPSMEMDELDAEPTEEDIKKRNYTRVTQLYIDRTPE